MHSSQTLKHRWLGFLLWQTLSTTLVYFLLTPIANPPTSLLPTIHSVFTFFFFHLSTLLFSLSVFLISSPHPHVPQASLYQIVHGFLRGLLRMVLGGFQGSLFEVGEKRRVMRTGEFGMFFAAIASSGFLGAIAVCGDWKVWNLWELFGIGIRGLFVGLLFGGYYIYCRRWVLLFPIVQMILPKVEGRLRMNDLQTIPGAVAVKRGKPQTRAQGILQLQILQIPPPLSHRGIDPLNMKDNEYPYLLIKTEHQGLVIQAEVHKKPSNLQIEEIEETVLIVQKTNLLRHHS